MPNPKTVSALIDRRANQPLVEQLFLNLKKAIMANKISFTELLPDPNDLANELQLDSDQVTAVYNQLIRMNLVARRGSHYQSNYSYASTFYLDHFKGMYDMIQLAGLKPSMRIVSHEIFNRDASDLPQDLAIQESVYGIKRVYYGNDIPIAMVCSYYPLSLYPHIEDIELTDVPYTPVLENTYGHRIHHYHQKLEIIQADEAQATTFGCHRNDPLMSFMAHGYDLSNQIIEYNMTLLYDSATLTRVARNHEDNDFQIITALIEKYR